MNLFLTGKAFQAGIDLSSSCSAPISAGLTRWWSKPASRARARGPRPGPSRSARPAQSRRGRAARAHARAPPRSRPCRACRCRAARRRGRKRVERRQRGRAVVRDAHLVRRASAAAAPRLSAASRLSSTTRMRAPAASASPAPRGRGASARRRPRARAAGARRTRCPCRARRCAPRPCRRAARPGCAPASGRCPGRPARARARGRPARTARRRAAASPARCRCRCRARDDHRVAVLAPRRERDARRPASVYLAALLSRLASTCASRTGSASSAQRLARQRRRSSCVAAGVDQRPAGLDGAAHARRPARPRSVRSSILPRRDARDVEQVVDQAHQVVDLALDHRAHRRRPRRRPPPACAACCSALRIGASGLRSSCASIARNSSLRRSASLQRGFCRAAPRDLLLCTLIKARVIDGDRSLRAIAMTRRSARSVNTARLAHGRRRGRRSPRPSARPPAPRDSCARADGPSACQWCGDVPAVARIARVTSSTRTHAFAGRTSRRTRGVARHAELGERLALRAGERVEDVGLAGVVDAL